jgi:hypothetical protein
MVDLRVQFSDWSGLRQAGVEVLEAQKKLASRAFSSGVGPVRVKKTRQMKNLERRSDPIGTGL